MLYCVVPSQPQSLNLTIYLSLKPSVEYTSNVNTSIKPNVTRLVYIIDVLTVCSTRGFAIFFLLLFCYYIVTKMTNNTCTIQVFLSAKSLFALPRIFSLPCVRPWSVSVIRPKKLNHLRTSFNHLPHTQNNHWFCLWETSSHYSWLWLGRTS